MSCRIIDDRALGHADTDLGAPDADIENRPGIDQCGAADIDPERVALVMADFEQGTAALEAGVTIPVRIDDQLGVAGHDNHAPVLKRDLARFAGHGAIDRGGIVHLPDPQRRHQRETCGKCGSEPGSPGGGELFVDIIGRLDFEHGGALFRCQHDMVVGRRMLGRLFEPVGKARPVLESGLGRPYRPGGGLIENVAIKRHRLLLLPYRRSPCVHSSSNRSLSAARTR